MLQITGYKNLYLCVEQLRKEVFDSEKEEHEKMLLKVILAFITSVVSSTHVTSLVLQRVVELNDSSDIKR